MQVNQKFGLWSLVKVAADAGTKAERWLCVCDCGTQRMVLTRSLKEGKTKSCGCRRVAVHRKQMDSSFKEATNGVR